MGIDILPQNKKPHRGQKKNPGDLAGVVVLVIPYKIGFKFSYKTFCAFLVRLSVIKADTFSGNNVAVVVVGIFHNESHISL
jgi:hypothetical protein